MSYIKRLHFDLQEEVIALMNKVLTGQAVFFNSKQNFEWLSSVYRADGMNSNDFFFSSSKLSSFFFMVLHKGNFQVQQRLFWPAHKFVSCHHVPGMERGSKKWSKTNFLNTPKFRSLQCMTFWNPINFVKSKRIAQRFKITSKVARFKSYVKIGSMRITSPK